MNISINLIHQIIKFTLQIKDENTFGKSLRMNLFSSPVKNIDSPSSRIFSSKYTTTQHISKKRLRFGMEASPSLTRSQTFTSQYRSPIKRSRSNMTNNESPYKRIKTESTSFIPRHKSEVNILFYLVNIQYIFNNLI